MNTFGCNHFSQNKIFFGVNKFYYRQRKSDAPLAFGYIDIQN